MGDFAADSVVTSSGYGDEGFCQVSSLVTTLNPRDPAVSNEIADSIGDISTNHYDISIAIQELMNIFFAKFAAAYYYTPAVFHIYEFWIICRHRFSLTREYLMSIALPSNESSYIHQEG